MSPDAAQPIAALRTPPASPWLAFALLLRWNANAHRTYLPLYVVVQAAMAVGIVIGFGFLVPDMSPDTALMLSTGAPTLLLVTVGLVIVPQAVGQLKTEGSFDWFRTLPLSRGLFLAADLVTWVGVALPGIALALGVAALRYDLALELSPWALPAAALVGLAAAAVGYGLASALPPMITMLATQLLVFFILLFSPIAFPVERLPGWLQGFHEVLPILPMADLMRAVLVTGRYQVEPASIAILLAWTALGVAVALRAMARRV